MTPLLPNSPDDPPRVAPNNDCTVEVDFQTLRRRKCDLIAEIQQPQSDGSQPTPEDLLPLWPTSAKNDVDFASLLLEDYSRREEKGEQPSVEDYAKRFPDHAEPLRGLIRQQEFLHSLGGNIPPVQTLRLPEVGEVLFSFKLQYLLGKGAFGRVYLAEQPDLARRRVALKVTAASGDEAQTLAQLQHTNIVPIYSVHEDSNARLRAVCMPYLGGASLSQVLTRLRNHAPHPTRGAELSRALAEESSPAISDTASTTVTPTSPPYANDTFTRTAVYLVAQLADALQHAHDRGVLHRDIKPSNVLLAGDGQPLLLDFNLAQNTRNEQARATVGGTVAYMSPEHLRALGSRNPEQAKLVDNRSDIYSLGMVLYEILAGESPFDQSASYTPLPSLIVAMTHERGGTTPSLRKKRPDLPWGLESILRTCLSPDPSKRYQRADNLSEDLRRFLADQPLKFAPELSTSERLKKWARRHPRLTSSGSVGTIAVVLLLASVGGLLGQHEVVANAKTVQIRGQFENRTLSALRLAGTKDDLGVPSPEAPESIVQALKVYNVLARDDWQDGKEWQRLSEADRHRLSEDVRELLMLLAWAKTVPPNDGPQDGRAALALLDRAQAIRALKPSPALALDRARYLELLGDATAAAAARDEAERIPPASARDHYLLGLEHARNHKYPAALAELDRALSLNPGHYWSYCLRGLCYQNLNKHIPAIADLSVCLAREQEAWIQLNRGYSFYLSGERAAALCDYSAAIERDPTLTVAYWNRGLVRLDLGDYAGAVEDFRETAARGRHDADQWLQLGLALQGKQDTIEADRAFDRALELAEKLGPGEQNAILRRYGIAIASRSPKKAMSALAKVQKANPNDAEANFGFARALVAQGKETEALNYLNASIVYRPDFIVARQLRAVILARAKNDNALADIDYCLWKEPNDGKTHYNAACVMALLSSVEPNAEKEALEHLENAFDHGYGREQAPDDPDLENLRRNPRFKALLDKRTETHRL
jgi:serine/threonine protein kinase/tetratricopeptide (TPR) repeat protein